MTAIVDHNTLYKDRLLEQFKPSPDLVGLIDSLQAGQKDLELTLQQLLTLRSIDTAFGVQLDIIGEILGQAREIINASSIPFFAYQNTSEVHDGYGTLESNLYGARYKLLNEATGSLRTLSDDEYKIFLKAKIYKNVGTLTIENLITALKYMLGATTVSINLVGNKVVDLVLIVDIPASVIALVIDNDVIPRPAGVRYNDVRFTSGDGSIFAFAGYGGGGTFGSVTDPTVGGTFTSI